MRVSSWATPPRVPAQCPAHWPADAAAGGAGAAPAETQMGPFVLRTGSCQCRELDTGAVFHIL